MLKSCLKTDISDIATFRVAFRTNCQKFTSHQIIPQSPWTSHSKANPNTTINNNQFPLISLGVTKTFQYINPRNRKTSHALIISKQQIRPPNRPILLPVQLLNIPIQLTSVLRFPTRGIMMPHFTTIPTPLCRISPSVLDDPILSALKIFESVEGEVFPLIRRSVCVWITVVARG